jgi:hypothetical protein
MAAILAARRQGEPPGASGSDAATGDAPTEEARPEAAPAAEEEGRTAEPVGARLKAYDWVPVGKVFLDPVDRAFELKAGAKTRAFAVEHRQRGLVGGFATVTVEGSAPKGMWRVTRSAVRWFDTADRPAGSSPQVTLIVGRMGRAK